MPKQPRIGAVNEAVSLSETVATLQRQVDGSASREEDIPLEAIMPSDDQVRKTFTRLEIEERKASLLEHGQIDPIKVYMDEGQLYILDGEIRWRSAGELGWETIRAVRVDRMDVFEYSLIDGLQDKTLVPCDRIRGVARYILERVDLEVTESSKKSSAKSGKPARIHEFASCIRRLAKLGDEEPRDEEDAAVYSALFALGQSPASMSANDIPYLLLEDEFVEYIHKGVPGRVVLASKKLTDVIDRINYLEECLKEGYSAGYARERLQEILNKESGPASPKKDPWIKQVEKIAKVSIDRENAAQVTKELSEKRDQLSALLAALESKIEEAQNLIE